MMNPWRLKDPDFDEKYYGENIWRARTSTCTNGNVITRCHKMFFLNFVPLANIWGVVAEKFELWWKDVSAQNTRRPFFCSGEILKPSNILCQAYEHICNGFQRKHVNTIIRRLCCKILRRLNFVLFQRIDHRCARPSEFKIITYFVRISIKLKIPLQ